MWYILYDEMLSKCQRGERNVGRAFFTHRALSTDLRRDGRTWWWNPMVFCSQEFVIVLCKYFLYGFFCNYFTRTSRASLMHHWFLTSLSPAIIRRREKKLHSSRLSFTDRGIFVNNRTWTLWHAHKYTNTYYRL